jgi:hypothetical protein
MIYYVGGRQGTTGSVTFVECSRSGSNGSVVVLVSTSIKSIRDSECGLSVESSHFSEGEALVTNKQNVEKFRSFQSSNEQEKGSQGNQKRS